MQLRTGHTEFIEAEVEQLLDNAAVEETHAVYASEDVDNATEDVYIHRNAYDALKSHPGGRIQVETLDGPRHICDECGFVAESGAGLAAHERSHEELEVAGDE